MENLTVFAKTNFRGKERTFGIKETDRRQHMYVIGKTGTGKSAMLANLIIQDIINGKGLCIVDPHGELIESIIDKIPKERISDVVYFNAADTEYPIGFNVLEVPDPKYKHLVASDLMGIFTKIWANVWSPRMEYILNNCVLALIDTPGTTLLGIPRILVDKDYRQQIIANIKDPVVKAFWIHEYEGWRDQFRNEAIVPIQNKVGQFLSTSLIRNVVGQPKSTINIQNLMNKEKILLINVSKGRIGEDNSALLGAMFITKIQMAAMERVRIPEAERKDFYLYVDEFQNFVTESFANILSEARKYRLDLIIAHQYVGQLIAGTGIGISTKVRDAIFGNVGTMLVFRVGATDAEFLEKEFEPEFNIQDIVNLPNYNIYLKLMVDGITSRPFSAVTLLPFSVAIHKDNTEEVIKISRQFYSRPRRQVEEDINRWSGFAGGKAPSFSSYDKSPEGRKEGDAGRKPYIKKEFTPRFRYADTLGEMGIEFEPQKRPPSLIGTMEGKEIKKEEILRPIQQVQGRPEVFEGRQTQDKPEKFISLKELPKTETLRQSQDEKEAHDKKFPDIEGLKEAIRKAIGQ